MDVLNTPQYFLAGFADGLFSGENPFEAGISGVMDRHSFVDTLKNHDVPFATPLGIAADIIVPGFIGAKWAKLSNLKGINRLKTIIQEEKLANETATLADHAVNAERNLNSAANHIDDLESLGERAARAQTAAGEAQAAAGQLGHAAAAGVEATTQADSVVNAAQVAANAATSASARAGRSRLWRAPGAAVAGIKKKISDKLYDTFGDGFEILKNNMVRSIDDALRKSPLFDGVGDAMANAVDRTQRITRYMRSAYASKADKIVAKLGSNPEDHRIWWRISHGLQLNPEQIALLANDADRSARIREAVEMTRKHFAEDFALKKSLGIREILGTHTTAVRRLGAGDRQLLYKLLNSPENLAELQSRFGALTNEEARVLKLAENILEEGGNIDELSQAVVVPLREVENYLPMIFTKAHREKLELEAFNRARDLELKVRGMSDPRELWNIATQRAHEYANRGRISPTSPEFKQKYNEFYQQITRQIRMGKRLPFRDQAELENAAQELTNRWAAKRSIDPNSPAFMKIVEREREKIIKEVEFNARRIAKAELHDPDEIVSGFQHSRGKPLGPMTEAQVVELEKQVVMNPQEILYTHGSSSGLAIGAAKGFGPTANLWHAIRKNYLLNHGITDEFRPESMSPVVKSGLDFIDRLHKLSTGNARMPFDKANAAAGQLADAMFLGPRTVFVQLMNLANSAAHAGAAHSFASMAEVMTNPEMRQIGARLAGVLPNMDDATSQASKFQRVMDKFSFIYKGIKKSDTLMRSQSAVAGILDATQREEQILRHVGAGRLDKARALVDRFKLDYNTDISYLLGEAKAIRHGDLMRVAEIASTKANFSNDLLNSQMAFSTPAGKFFLKFKQFAAHQTNFIGGMVNRFKQTKNPAEILRYGSMFGWTYGHLEPLLSLFKNKQTNAKEKSDAISKIQGMLTMGFLGYMGDAALALSSESEALGLGVVTGPIPNAALKAKSTIWHLTPFAWDPGKAVQSGPAVIRQAKNLWENSTQ